MARFRGQVIGNKGNVSRNGSATSGIETSGWEIGVRVMGRPDNRAGAARDWKDEFHIYATGGSNRRLNERKIGRLVLDKNDNLKFYPSKQVKRGQYED